MTKITIRKATRHDMPGVLALIRELADYERAPQEVVVTSEDLERDGFGSNPKFYCFVAERSNEIRGMACITSNIPRGKVLVFFWKILL